MKMKRELKKDEVHITFDKPEKDNFDGWYQRIERNGWRPISDKVLTPQDRVEIESNKKAKAFHFNPILRQKQTAKQKRNRKIRWLRKLYRDAKNAELINEQGDQVNPATVDSQRFQKQLEQLYENPFDDEKFLNMEDDQFDDEVNNLIEWCEDLDYDKYMENWHTLATSSKPEVPSDDNQVHVYQAGLGDITIGLNQNQNMQAQP